MYSFIILVIILNFINYSYSSNINNCVLINKYDNTSSIVLSNLKNCYVLYPPNNSTGRWEVTYSNAGWELDSVYLYNGLIDLNSINHYGIDLSRYYTGYSLTSIITIINGYISEQSTITATFIPTDLNADKCSSSSIGGINDIELSNDMRCILLETISQALWVVRFDWDLVKLNGFFVIVYMGNSFPWYDSSQDNTYITENQGSFFIMYYPTSSNSKINLEYDLASPLRFVNQNNYRDLISLHPVSFNTLSYSSPNAGSKWVLTLNDTTYLNGDALSHDAFCIQTKPNTYESYVGFIMNYNFGGFFNQTYNVNSYIKSAVVDASCTNITDTSPDLLLSSSSPCFVATDVSTQLFKWLIFVNAHITSSSKVFVGANNAYANIIGPLSIYNINYFGESLSWMYVYPLMSTPSDIPNISISLYKVHINCLTITSLSGTFSVRPYEYTCWNFDVPNAVEVKLSGYLTMKNGDCMSFGVSNQCTSGPLNLVFNFDQSTSSISGLQIAYTFGTVFESTYTLNENDSIQYEVKTVGFPVYAYILIALGVLILLIGSYFVYWYYYKQQVISINDAYQKI